MTDPRNVAHDKKVQQEKKHHGEVEAQGATEHQQPGKKPALEESDKEETYQQHLQHSKNDKAT